MLGLQQPYVMKKREIDPRFNKGNKLRPKYESPLDILQRLEEAEPLRNAPKQTRLQPPMQNLAYDPRVYRGNMNHRKRVENEPVIQRPKRRYRKMEYSDTPEPVQGRHHMDIQTSAYLEAQSTAISYNDFDTQTDAFLDRPQTPFFIPWKSGPDAFTQIFAGDLFDFDMEIEPICEVLAGRALEQGFMEVQEEKQLEHLRNHQDMFEQMRVAELTATQRMEAAERRIMEEKDRRLKQEQDRLKEETFLRLRTEAMGYAMRILKKITDEVYDKLTKAGYFYDPVSRELENEFIPGLIKNMQTEVGMVTTSRNVVAIMAEMAIPSIDEAERPDEGLDIVMISLMNALDFKNSMVTVDFQSMEPEETFPGDVLIHEPPAHVKAVVGVEPSTTSVTATLEVVIPPVEKKDEKKDKKMDDKKGANKKKDEKEDEDEDEDEKEEEEEEDEDEEEEEEEDEEEDEEEGEDEVVAVVVDEDPKVRASIVVDTVTTVDLLVNEVAGTLAVVDKPEASDQLKAEW